MPVFPRFRNQKPQKCLCEGKMWPFCFVKKVVQMKTLFYTRKTSILTSEEVNLSVPCGNLLVDGSDTR